MKSYIYEKALIIGLGLVGGSLARALSERKLVREIIGYDHNQCSLELALTRGYIHRRSHLLVESIPEADLIIWALPVKAISSEIARYAACFRTGQVVTDVGSVKQTVLEAANLLPAGAAFIGGHPMAGKEFSGIASSDSKLFEGRPWVLTPPPDVGREKVERLARLVSSVGACPVQMSAAEHDKTVALLSHLPQLVATSLMNTVGEFVDELPTKYLLAAGGFTDTTRIAGSNPEMWRDVCLANRSELLHLLNAYAVWVSELRNSLAAEDSATIERLLQNALQKKNASKLVNSVNVTV